MRRKLATETPGIVAGYWKARNRPARARSSGSASVRSSPFEQDAALGDLVGRGCPSACWRAWTCPSRSGPSGRASRPSSRRGRRRGGSPAPRCGRAGSGSSRVMRWLLLPSPSGSGRTQVGQRHVVQGADDGPLDAGPEKLGGAGLVVPWPSRAQTSTPSASAVMHSIGAISPSSARTTSAIVISAGLARERVAAVRAAPGLDQPGLAQPLHEVLEVGERKPLGVGDRAERDRVVAVASCARCAITRTPYSALVENITRQILPT